MFLGGTIASTARTAVASLTQTAVATTEIGAAAQTASNTSTNAFQNIINRLRGVTAAAREASVATRSVGTGGTAGIPGGVPAGGGKFAGMGGMGLGMAISLGLMAAASMTDDSSSKSESKSPVMSAAQNVKNEQDGGDVFVPSSAAKSSQKILIAGENAIKLSDNDEIAASPNLRETFNTNSSVKQSKKEYRDSSNQKYFVNSNSSADVKVTDTVVRNQLVIQQMQQNIEKKSEKEELKQKEFFDRLETRASQSMNFNAKLHIDGKEVVTTLGPHTVDYLDNHTEHTRKTINKVANALGTSAAV